MDLTERYKLMIDECAKLWGGLEICALDLGMLTTLFNLHLVHSKDNDREYILELNDTGMNSLLG